MWVAWPQSTLNETERGEKAWCETEEQGGERRGKAGGTRPQQPVAGEVAGDTRTPESDAGKARRESARHTYV